MSEEGINSATPEQWQLYLKLFQNLGQLQSVGTPQLQNSSVVSTFSTGRTTYVEYIVPLIFDTGEAHVQLGLKHNDDKVEINNIRFLSDLLIK